jgi:hypothetical protein
MKKAIVTLAKDRSKVIKMVTQAPDGYVVEIKQANRTIEQNSLYWTAVHEIAESIFLNGKAFTPEVWHVYFKQRYLSGRMIELPNGQLIEADATTTELSKEEFSDFVNAVLAFQAENQ